LPKTRLGVDEIVMHRKNLNSRPLARGFSWRPFIGPGIAYSRRDRQNRVEFVDTTAPSIIDGTIASAISVYLRTMQMKTRAFPRRVEIAAAMFAALMFMFVFVPNASAQRIGCLPSEANSITAHGFCDGFTDLVFTPPGDILSLTGPQRIIFDHGGPLSYSSATKLLQIQSLAGSREDFGEFIGRVNIAAYVENNGALIKDAAMFTCGTGDPASFCVQATDGTVLLRGQVKGFTYSWNKGLVFDPIYAQSYDDFDFYVKLTGGTRMSVYGSYMAVSVHSFSFPYLGRSFAGRFDGPADDPNCDVINADSSIGSLTCSFGGGILGVMGTSMQYGMLIDQCNGQISGTAVNGLLNWPLSGDQISVIGGDLSHPEVRYTSANGKYAVTSTAAHATGLCAGTYQVRADVPDGFVPGDLYPTSRTVTFAVDGSGNTVPSVAGANVVNYAFWPSISNDFKTFGQGAWGANPFFLNAGTLLRYYYVVVYGTDTVVLGNVAAGKYLSMSGPVPVQNLLPQGGRPLPLDGPYVDPITQPNHRKPHNRLGSLVGEGLALRLNVDFSNAGVTRFGLGALFVTRGPLVNCTVNQVLAYGNKVLGGAPLLTGLKYDDVEDTMESINGSFDGGRKGDGYIKAAPASAAACKVQ
jgi:hypothetical protein